MSKWSVWIRLSTQTANSMETHFLGVSKDISRLARLSRGIDKTPNILTVMMPIAGRFWLDSHGHKQHVEESSLKFVLLTSTETQLEQKSPKKLNLLFCSSGHKPQIPKFPSQGLLGRVCWNGRKPQTKNKASALHGVLSRKPNSKPFWKIIRLLMHEDERRPTSCTEPRGTCLRGDTRVHSRCVHNQTPVWFRDISLDTAAGGPFFCEYMFDDKWAFLDVVAFSLPIALTTTDQYISPGHCHLFAMPWMFLPYI